MYAPSCSQLGRLANAIKADNTQKLSDAMKNMSPEEFSKVKTAFANINEKAKSGAYDNITDEQFNSDEDVKAVGDMVHFSISPDFASNYDQWVKDGRPDRKNITVGRTSEALQSIGVKEQRITWDTSKINDSLKKHKYLDDGIMKQIPQLIENPIIVMQSKEYDSRITMFGEVYDGDGLPVMAVLELLPQNYAKTLVLDEIKVTSTHSRKNLNKPSDMTQTQSIIDSSKILYVEPNKNRTDNWLTLNRLQLPLSVTNYGSINKISYPSEIVNSNSSILPTKSDNVLEDAKTFGETQKKFFDVFGVKVEMDESLDANAKILLFDGVVKVSPYASIDDWAITRHEFTHLLKMQYPEAYEIYARIAKQEIGDRWDSLYEETKKAYEEYAKKHPEDIKKVTPELIEEEVLSRYAEGFDNNAFIEKVVAENATIGAKIRNFINNIIKKIKSLFSKSDLKANSENIKKLVTAKQAWEDAVLRAVKGGKIKFEGKSGVMLSITNIKGNKGDYGMGVYLDTDLFNGIKPRNWGEKLSKFVYENLAGETIYAYNEEGNAEQIQFAKKEERVKKDGANNSHRVIDKLARKRGNIQTLSIVHIDELLKTSVYENSSGENLHQWLDQNGWEYRKTYIQDIKGKIYEATLNIAKARDGRKILYDISNIKEVDGGVVPSIPKKRGSLTTSTSKDTISQERQSVKIEDSASTPDKLQKLESENAHLKEVNSILKRFFRQTAMVHVDALHISEIAEDVKKRYETHMPARDIGSELQRIYSKMAEDGARAETDKERADAATRGANELYALAEKILEESDFVDRTMYNTYADLRQKKTEVSKQGTTVNSVAQNSRSVSISISDISMNVNIFTRKDYSEE